MDFMTIGAGVCIVLLLGLLVAAIGLWILEAIRTFPKEQK